MAANNLAECQYFHEKHSMLHKKFTEAQNNQTKNGKHNQSINNQIKTSQSNVFMQSNNINEPTLANNSSTDRKQQNKLISTYRPNAERILRNRNNNKNNNPEINNSKNSNVNGKSQLNVPSNDKFMAFATAMYSVFNKFGNAF